MAWHGYETHSSQELGYEAAVAVLDSIVHRLRYRDHDVAVNVVVQVELLLRVVNKAFNHADILHYRRYLDTDGIHECFIILISAHALKVLIHFLLVIRVEFWRDGF